ncbi:MAG: amidohydrolase, partial [Ilumatobacteraceae bacterium]
MNINDLVLVSIDDHVVEPPNMFDGRLAAKYVDDAPRVVKDDNGVDRWMYRGNQTGVVGLNAVVSWPKSEWGFDPAGFDEMRPGSYDIHARVRDMDVNGITASMCFPTFAGFSGAMFQEAVDKELALAVVQAYNDWHL